MKFGRLAAAHRPGSRASHRASCRVSTPAGFDLPSLSVGLPLSPSRRPETLPVSGLPASVLAGLAAGAGGGKDNPHLLPAWRLAKSVLATRGRFAFRPSRVLAYGCGPRQSGLQPLAAMPSSANSQQPNTGSAHETVKIVRYALSCQPSTMIDMPSSATPAPVQSSADSFTPSTTRSQTSAVAT